MSETYEQLRDTATGDARTAWEIVDRERIKLRDVYQNLKEDSKYADSYKSEQAWAAYATAKERIEANALKAREALEKQARTAERFSVPFVAEESLITSDTSKLLASQNEAARIARKLDRLSANAKGPLAPDRTKTLKQEYERGLRTGGVAGAAICRGVLSACDELGVDLDSVVDDFRNSRHDKNLDDAQHNRRLTQLISKETPKPPFPRPGTKSPKEIGDYGARNFQFVGRDSQGSVPLSPSQRKPGGSRRRKAPWK